MNDWLHGMVESNRRGEPVVLVTVADTRGSTPREAGAKMTVGATGTWDTIGGGQFEHAAIESARLLLEDGERGYVNAIEHHELGPALGQCCGGVASLLLERFPGGAQPWLDALMAARRESSTVVVATRIGGSDKHVLKDPFDASGEGLPGNLIPIVRRAMETGLAGFDATEDGPWWFVDPVPPTDFHVVLFGAGHVGTALAGILAALPCDLTWVDSRRHQFPEDLGGNVRGETVRYPETLVDECPPGSFYVVMTHSHPLDLAICERILTRGDFNYCGLIGSKSKRRNFEKRLRRQGVTESALNRLTCPIGVAGISGKRPAEIAVAVAAEVLQVREAAHPADKAAGNHKQ